VVSELSEWAWNKPDTNASTQSSGTSISERYTPLFLERSQKVVTFEQLTLETYHGQTCGALEHPAKISPHCRKASRS